MTPRRLAERMRARQHLGDGFVRQMFTLPRDAARVKARDIPPMIIKPRSSSGERSGTVRSNLRCGGFQRLTS